MAYTTVLQNATDQPWVFVLYQSNIAWKVHTLQPPPPDSPPTTAEVVWTTTNYGVCIADFDQAHKKFTVTQSAPASLDKVYQVVSKHGKPVISTTPVGVTTSDQIGFTNNTGEPAIKLNMGYTFSDSLDAVEQDVGGEQEVMFRESPTYHIACYHSMEAGQLVDSEKAAIGPVKVDYSSSAPIHTALAYGVAGAYDLKAI